MKPKTTPIVIAVLLPLVSVVIALSLIYFKKRDFSGLEAFPYQTFVQEPKNLQGNKYLLKAELEVQLANFDNGRLVSVKESQSDGRLAVFIPSDLSLNIVTKQRYEMNVRVTEKGQVMVESMKKY